jgi:hypothetical protein
MRVTQGVIAPSIVHDDFPSIARVGKGERISQADSCSLIMFSCAQTSPSSSFVLELSATFQISSTTHDNGVHPPCLSLPVGGDLTKLRRLLGWQSPGYDGRVWFGVVLLGDLQPGEFIFFTSYALAGLVLPFSSFFFMLQEPYDLQPHHLSPHSITLVAIFIHLCEMYVGKRSSMRLF